LEWKLDYSSSEETASTVWKVRRISQTPVICFGVCLAEMVTRKRAEPGEPWVADGRDEVAFFGKGLRGGDGGLGRAEDDGDDGTLHFPAVAEEVGHFLGEEGEVSAQELAAGLAARGHQELDGGDAGGGDGGRLAVV
jgi:hypothetical protein